MGIGLDFPKMLERAVLGQVGTATAGRDDFV